VRTWLLFVMCMVMAVCVICMVRLLGLSTGYQLRLQGGLVVCRRQRVNGVDGRNAPAVLGYSTSGRRLL
jgi:hypothetical protein